MVNKNICILLTGCVNPNGTVYTKIQNPTQREKEYIDAINFYLNNTNLKIIFVENSNHQVFNSIYSKEIESGRLECLCFNGNNFDKNLGKGYGEFEIIDYAFKHSKFLNISEIIIKITGRLKITNIQEIIENNKYISSNPFYIGNFRRDVYSIWTQIFISDKSSFQMFLVNKELVNDTKKIYFEDVVLKTLETNHQIEIHPLKPIPIIEGNSGTTNIPYSTLINLCGSISIDYDIEKINEIRQKNPT